MPVETRRLPAIRLTWVGLLDMHFRDSTLPVPNEAETCEPKVEYRDYDPIIRLLLASHHGKTDNICVVHLDS